ncbi:MAG: hypothetical protein ABW352_23240 [Polyangiales bacterium]
MHRLCLIALLSLCASGARADAWHFSLESGLLSWRRSTTELPFRDSNTKQVAVGFPSGLGARVGYLPLEVLEVGLYGSVHWTKFKIDGSSANKLANFEALAYARYVLPGKALRFFVGPTIGIAFQQSRAEDQAALTSRALVVGGQLGLYGFVRDALSIDPFLSFLFTRGTLEVPNDLPGGFGGRTEYDDSGIQLVLGVAVSGWLVR